MKQEGFLNGALNVVRNKQVSAKWLANQSGFNNTNSEINPDHKASIIFALNVFNSEVVENELDELITQAHQTNNVGEINAIIEAASNVIKDAGKWDELKF